jgi:hypothetical protein
LNIAPIKIRLLKHTSIKIEEIVKKGTINPNESESKIN